MIMINSIGKPDLLFSYSTFLEECLRTGDLEMLSSWYLFLSHHKGGVYFSYKFIIISRLYDLQQHFILATIFLARPSASSHESVSSFHKHSNPPYQSLPHPSASFLNIRRQAPIPHLPPKVAHPPTPTPRIHAVKPGYNT
jgi:hypothetical protein